MTDTWSEVIMPQFTRSVPNGEVPKVQQRVQITGSKISHRTSYSYDKAAKRLGTTGFSVRNWVKAFQQTGELPSKAESQPKVDEIRQLRKELAQLKMENEILKKAAAYFAKESL